MNNKINIFTLFILDRMVEYYVKDKILHSYLLINLARIY